MQRWIFTFFLQITILSDWNMFLMQIIIFAIFLFPGYLYTLCLTRRNYEKIGRE